MSTLPQPTQGRWRRWSTAWVRAWRRWRSPAIVQLAFPNEVVDLRHDVLRPGRPRESAIWNGDSDPETRHWTILWAGEVVGVATVLARSEPTHTDVRWQLRGMAIADNARGKGLGAALLHRVIRDVDDEMWCNARESAKTFYEHHGWVAPDAPFDIPRIGPHYRMFHRVNA